MRLRPLLLAALMAAPNLCAARQILIRQVVTPPPTTFAGLRQTEGVTPSGPCDLPVVTLDTALLVPVALGDTGSLGMPPGWSVLPLYEGQDPFTVTRLAGPDGSRALIQRRRNGSQGRSHLMYRNDERAVGPTCLVDRDSVGAIWTFYLPDPGVPDSPRPFLADGDIMTPDGRWYGIMISSETAEARARTASMLTAVALRAAIRE
jgi:hypothetical protein